MVNEALETYVANQVRSGIKKSDIRDMLLAVGWSEEEADAAYAQALLATGVPVPSGAGRGAIARKSSTADIMIGFFSFILLGIIVSALGSLFFEIIDRYFPDAVANQALGSVVSSDAVHYSMAALLVSAPLYSLALRLWFRRFREDDARMESRLTKWITYLVLLVAATTLVGDSIAIFYTLLQGEMSVRFFLKAGVIFAIAGMIFGFYFLERKKIQYKKDISRQTFQLFGWGFLAVIVCGVVLGFVAAGSPTEERNRTFDARRASDLGTLADCVRGYANEFSRMPDTLSDLGQSSQYGYCLELKDPETGVPYEYRVTKDFDPAQNRGEAEFELCAVFSTVQNGTMTNRSRSPYSVPLDTASGKWNVHGIGRTCHTEMIVVKRNSQSLQ